VTRNQIIALVAVRLEALKLSASLRPAAGLWAKVGELERFVTDLTRVPNRHNRALGLRVYTLVEARREWRRLCEAVKLAERQKRGEL
jgi:hypothetical protein